MEKIVITKKDDLFTIKVEDVWFFHIAEGGAMGCPGEVIVVTKHGKRYIFNYIESEISFIDVLEFFPPLNDFCSLFGDTITLPKGWQHVYTGAGNHLLVSDEIYDEFYAEIKDIEPYYKVYNAWHDKAEKIISKRDI